MTLGQCDEKRQGDGLSQCQCDEKEQGAGLGQRDEKKQGSGYEVVQYVAVQNIENPSGQKHLALPSQSDPAHYSSVVIRQATSIE